LEKRQDIAAAGVEEDMHVRVWFAGGRHPVLGDGGDKRHVKVFAVPLDGLLGVAAAVGDVVDLFDWHVTSLAWKLLAEPGYARMNGRTFSLDANSWKCTNFFGEARRSAFR